jgi:hypothetical protein
MTPARASCPHPRLLRLALLLTHPHLVACRKLFFLKALGPLSVCVLSIALMNIFGW